MYPQDGAPDWPTVCVRDVVRQMSVGGNGLPLELKQWAETIRSAEAAIVNAAELAPDNWKAWIGCLQALWNHVPGTDFDFDNFVSASQITESSE